jgi:hypothetical protein
MKVSEEVDGAALNCTVEHADGAGTHLKFLGNGVLLVAFDAAPTGDLARRRCLGPAFDVCGACDEWGALVAVRADAQFLATLPLIKRVRGGNGSKENIAVLMLKRRLLGQNMISVHDAAAACGIGSRRGVDPQARVVGPRRRAAERPGRRLAGGRPMAARRKCSCRSRPSSPSGSSATRSPIAILYFGCVYGSLNNTRP